MAGLRKETSGRVERLELLPLTKTQKISTNCQKVIDKNKNKNKTGTYQKRYSIAKDKLQQDGRRSTFTK